MRKVILYIAMSLDGYIATHEGDISFLSPMQKEGQDYGYADFIKEIDTIIIGRKTYDKVLSMGYQYPHNDKNVFIITRTPQPDHGTFKYYSGPLKDLVLELRSKPGKNIFCDGGASIVNELLRHNLIDEFIISIVPVMLGSGIALFEEGRPGLEIELVSCRKFDTGLIQLYYKTVR